MFDLKAMELGLVDAVFVPELTSVNRAVRTSLLHQPQLPAEHTTVIMH